MKKEHEAKQHNCYYCEKPIKQGTGKRDGAKVLCGKRGCPGTPKKRILKKREI